MMDSPGATICASVKFADEFAKIVYARAKMRFVLFTRTSVVVDGDCVPICTLGTGVTPSPPKTRPEIVPPNRIRGMLLTSAGGTASLDRRGFLAGEASQRFGGSSDSRSIDASAASRETC